MDDLVIDHDSDVPPFEQLRSQIAGRVARGELAPGTRLGTVRETAQRLGVAVNTVARAYRELEGDGVVVTEGRRGTFVRSGLLDGAADGGGDGDGDGSGDDGGDDARQAASDHLRAARQAATDYVRAARRAGLTRAEALRLLDRTWP